MQIFSNSFIFSREDTDQQLPPVTSKDAKEVLARVDQDIADGKLDINDPYVAFFRLHVQRVSVRDGIHPPFPSYPEYKTTV